MKDHFLKIFDHDAEANNKILKILRGSKGIPEKARAIFRNTILTQQMWIDRITNGESSVDTAGPLPESLWQRQMNENYLQISEYTRNTSDMYELVEFTDSEGIGARLYLKDILHHLIIRSGYNRGIIISVMNKRAETILEIDYIYYLRK
ncbi:MAG: hypothetical protein ACLFR2_06115 [Candidatus Kapaibacterium sp.]